MLGSDVHGVFVQLGVSAGEVGVCVSSLVVRSGEMLELTLKQVFFYLVQSSLFHEKCLAAQRFLRHVFSGRMFMLSTQSSPMPTDIEWVHSAVR